MRNITVFIKGGRRELYLSDNIDISPGSEAVMKCVRATVFWDYNNVISGVNDTFTHNGNLITVPAGYWTADMIKKITDECIVRVGPDDAFHYSSINDLYMSENGGGQFLAFSNSANYIVNLGAFGTLIGFGENYNLPPQKRRLSGEHVDLNRGLKYITVSCDIVDEARNTGTDGDRSFTVVTLPIPGGDVNMKHAITRHNNDDNTIVIKAGYYNRLVFSIDTNIGNVGIGSVLLELTVDDK